MKAVIHSMNPKSTIHHFAVGGRITAKVDGRSVIITAATAREMGVREVVVRPFRPDSTAAEMRVVIGG